MPYQSIWNHRASEITQALEKVAREYPDEWQAAHNPARGNKAQREAYCERVCVELRALGIPAGMNGKRGNPDDRSEDVIALPNVDPKGRSYGGVADASGRFVALELRDIIAGAGPDAEGRQAGRVVFGDVTAETMAKGEVGCYVEPRQGDVGVRPAKPGRPKPAKPATETADLAARLAALERQVGYVLTGLGALATQIGNLEGKVLNADGAFDVLTKRLFGIGTDEPSLAEEVVRLLQELPEDERTGALEGCRVVSYLRQRR